MSTIQIRVGAKIETDTNEGSQYGYQGVISFGGSEAPPAYVRCTEEEFFSIDVGDTIVYEQISVIPKPAALQSVSDDNAG